MEERDLFSESMEDLMDKIEKGEFPDIAQGKLDAGHPVIYCDDKYPGKIIREYPDGGKEFVGLDEDGKTIVVGFPG